MTKWLSIRLIRWFSHSVRTPIETLICVLIFSSWAVNAACSQDVWDPATGDWSTAGNWSLGRVPGTTDDVVVDNGGRAIVSTAGGTSYTIHNLAIGATRAGSTVEINDGVTLHISALTIGAAGTISVDAGGSFLQSGGFTNNGNFIINNASVNAGPIGGTGTVTKESDLPASWAAPLNAGASVIVNGGTFTDNTAANGNAGVNVTVNAGTFIDNTGSLGNLTVTGTTSVLQVSGGFALNAPPVLNNGGTLHNFGTITGSVDGVDSSVGGATVTNEVGGVIAGTNFAGVFVNGGAGNVTNSGTISGNTAAVFLNQGGTVANLVGGAIHGNANDGVFVNGGAATVINSGTITGQNGVRFDGPGGSLTNNIGGNIQASAGAGVGTFPGSFMNLTNSGTITGVSGVFFFSPGTITNNVTGTITGTAGTAIEAVGGAITLSNAGIINGNVILGNFANSVTLLTGGKITGNLGSGSSAAASLTLGGAGTQILSQAVTGTMGGFFSLAKEGTGTWTIDENLTYAGGTTITAGTLQLGNGGITGSISGNVSNAGALIFNRSDSLTFAGLISGSGTVAQNGGGTLILTGNNTYTGGTTINAGTLQLGNGGTTGSVAGNVIDNGALIFNRSNSLTYGGAISGSGSVTQNGSGTLTLTVTNSYRGGTNLNAGVLAVAADGNLGNGPLNFNGGTLEILGTNGGITSSKQINLGRAGGLVLADTGTVSTLGGAIGGVGAFSKSGAGTVTLIGTNSYAGGTNIIAGTLQLGDSGRNGSIVGGVVDNGNLVFSRVDSVLFDGAISGTGTVVQSGTGTTTLTAKSTYTGGTTINAGRLQLGNGATTGSIVGSVVDNGVLVFNRSDAVTFDGIISGNGSVSQDGAGTVILAADNSYSGGTVITNGTLQMGNGATTGSISGSVSNNGALIFNRSDTLTFAGLISGSGTVAQNGGGMLILTGNNTYTGGTTINAGTLQLGNGGTTGNVAGNVIDNGTLIFNRSDSVTFDGVISGTGSLTETGGGMLVLGAGNTYSGGTLINGGTIVVAASNALGTGSVNVNDPSILRINPGVTITNFIQIHNTGSLDNFGTVQVTQASRGPSAAVTTSEGATITNEPGATISGVGINGIQSLNGSVTITNSGTISGIQGIQLGGEGTIANNPTGSITGSTGVAILASAGQTTLSNSGSLNGNVTLSNSSNTVQLFTGSRINGNLDLGNNAESTLILDGGGTQTFSQAVTGTVNNKGSLTKQGPGTWIIDTILNAPISTKLLDGILEVNGSLRSSSVTVQPGATLKGVGNVVGNIFNFGTLSPGNSPGTLTVNGNFSQGPNGVFNVQIVSLQNYSHMAVTGHANLDGTLRLTLASGFRPPAGSKFVVLTAGQGISGTFRSISTNAPVKVTYESGLVDVVSASQPKPEIHLSDGTPVSTTALLADYTFFGFGSLAERAALGLVETGGEEKNNAISLTFDAGEFDTQGHHGETYTIPIARQFKISNRMCLDYEIPLQYIQVAGMGLFQAGVTLDLPTKVIIPSPDQPWSWDVTPAAAIAASGGKEIVGGGALTNVIAYRWRGITATYGNYISFFKGNVLDNNDTRFSSAVDQQIMKNGLRLDVPFAKSWLVEGYGIYTQFFQSAAVGSYWTIGAEVGHHFTWKVENQVLDLGYLSVGLYTEFGNRYSSGHFQLGSAWKF